MCQFNQFLKVPNKVNDIRIRSVSPCRSVVCLRQLGLHQTQTCQVKETLDRLYSVTLKIAQKSDTLQRIQKVLPGNTKIKQAANPPISEITRPISGMKRARTRVTTNHTSVCRIRLLLSRRTHTSTCSPWKRSHSPSTTALEGIHNHTRVQRGNTALTAL